MTLAEKIRQQDEAAEFQMRLDLRAALAAALELLLDPDAEPQDADRVTALIIQTLKDTTP